ncbi:MAG: sugar ABC transporter permease [Catenulispora sp.]|nr:sugar ABC transporter permease [Catenulispora sp.]
MSDLDTPLRPPGARRGRRTSTSPRLFGLLMFSPFFAVFAFAIVAPVLYAVYLSLFQDRLIGGSVFVGLRNYGQALEDPQLRAGLERVGVFLLIQVPIMLGLALLAALAVDSGRLRWPAVFRIGLFIPYAVPAVVAALMWGYMYGPQFGLIHQAGAKLGAQTPDLLSSSWALASIGNITTWEFVGYNMLILYAALQTVPHELYEAAAMDGAGEIRKALSIKIPGLRRALLLTTIFSIIGSFQLFNEPNVLQTLAPGVISTSYTPNMYAYNLAFNGQQFTYAASIAMILGGVTAVVAYTVQLRANRGERTR